MGVRPFYSVVTVTKDYSEGLIRTHESLFRQVFQDWEWIVIDGGTDEDTSVYLSGKNARWLREQDAGIYDAMNKGIEQARGHYIIFMNAGDCFSDHNILQHIFSVVESCDVSPDFIYGDSYELYLDGSQYYKRARSSETVLWGMFTHHQAMIYKRDSIRELRYDLRYKIAADYDFTLRFLTRDVQQKSCYVSDPFCIFESGGVSQKQASLGRAEQYCIRALWGQSVFVNMFVFMAQAFLLRVRRLCPGFYRFLRR